MELYGRKSPKFGAQSDNQFEICSNSDRDPTKPFGLITGAGFAAAFSKLLRNALYGVSNLDPRGYAGAIGVLVAIVVVAALSRRALRLDVARALHHH
jgi:hypothetical protein